MTPEKTDNARVSTSETNQKEASGIIKFAPKSDKSSGIIDADAVQAARFTIRPKPCSDIIEVL